MAERPRSTELAPAAPIVLCCAIDEVETLQPVVTELQRRGHRVEAIGGVDLDPRALAGTIERNRGGGLYVLVRGGSLDRERIDAVREVLLAHRVPFGRTLTLALGRSDELLERIDQSLRRMVAHLPAPPRPDAAASPAAPATPPERPRRATISVTPPAPASAGKPAPPPPPPRSAPPPPPGAVEPTRVDGRADDVAAPVPASQTNTGALELDDDALEDVTSIRPSAPIEIVPPVSIDDAPSDDELARSLEGIGGDKTQVASLRTGTLVASTIPFEGYPDDDVPDVPPPGYEKHDVTQVGAALPPAPRVSTTATTPASATPARATVVAAVVEEKPSRARFIGAAIAASLAVVSLVAVVLSSNEDDDAVSLADRSEPTPESVRSAAAAREPAATPEPPGKPQPATVEPARAEPPRVADDGAPTRREPAAPEPKPDPEPEPTPDPEPDPKPKPTPTPKPPPRPDPEPEPEAKPVRARAPSAAAIEAARPPSTRAIAALRARSIRALDVLLVARNVKGTMASDAAAKHCDALEVGGLQTWRLPEVGELASLTDAGMLAAGSYWTATAADTFGDRRMAWNVARRQATPRFKPAAVVCVRGNA
ncbi:MAG: hypothetical protein K1X88_01600 [Nannocystaceae bacterium]|nr:hypothetical protein [Nannocystaceae bacterium]